MNDATVLILGIVFMAGCFALAVAIGLVHFIIYGFDACYKVTKHFLCNDE